MTRNQHPTGQGIRAMRSNGAAGGFREIVDRFHVSRFRRISVHVKNKHSAVIKTCKPELVAVVGEPAVVRLVAALDRRATDGFAIARRARFRPKMKASASAPEKTTCEIAATGN